MAVEWKMPRRSERCVGCETAFEVGDVIFVSLYETADEGYERRDTCENCVIPDDPQRIGSWRTRRPEPSTPRTRPFDREALLGFFDRLAEPETLAQVQFRFVLALFLWRKKAIEFETSRPTDAGETWVFTQGERRIELERPPLDEDEVERLSLQLEELMQAGVPVDEASAEEPADA